MTARTGRPWSSGRSPGCSPGTSASGEEAACPLTPRGCCGGTVCGCAVNKRGARPGPGPLRVTASVAILARPSDASHCLAEMNHCQHREMGIDRPNASYPSRLSKLINCSVDIFFTPLHLPRRHSVFVYACVCKIFDIPQPPSSLTGSPKQLTVL